MEPDAGSPPFGTEHASLRGSIVEVVESALRPRLASWTSADVVPVREVLGILADTGCLGAGFPEHLGGTGGDLWHSVVVHEELARLASSAIATAVLSHLEVGARLLANHASPETARRWVPDALRGMNVLAYAATEEEAGSDLASTTTSARRDGNEWIIEGRKKFITNGHQADALCVLARTSDRGVTSHTLFVVPTSGSGVRTRPLSTMGNRGTLAEVWFDDVHVGEDAIIGLEGQGLLLQISRLAHERAFVAISLTAAADTVLRSLIVQSRAHGHSDSHRSRAFRLAELTADLEEARHLAYHAISTVQSGGDARTPAAMAKLTAGRVVRAVTGHALAVIEGPAYAGDLAAAQAYDDALGFAFAGGTDHMLLEAIAR